VGAHDGHTRCAEVERKWRSGVYYEGHRHVFGSGFPGDSENKSRMNA
jgi:hypothetical protein